MADVVKSVTIKYSNEGMAEMTRQLESYSGTLRTITSQVKNADGVWATMKQTTTQTSTAYSALGNVLTSTMMKFIGVNAIIGQATKAYHELRQFIDDGVKAFRSFEVQMAGVNAILTDTTRTALPSLEVGITNLSIKFGKSVGDLSTGLMEIVKAGFSVTDAMNLLNVATKTAIAGMASIESTTTTLTEILNAYGMSVSNASHLSDELFQTVARGNMTLDSLQSALGYIIPIAADAGVQFQDVAAAISTATRAGQHIDSVTRGLGLMIQGLVNPTKSVQEAMAKYGISVDETSLSVNGLTDFFQQINDATKKYGSQILPQLITNMRSLRVAMALTSDEGVKGMATDMGLLENATGRTDDALASMMNTQQKLADILDQSMQKVERSVGEAWSGVDIWWKKVQLWWGTLFSGGNADAAVQAFDTSAQAIKQAYLDNIVSPASSNETTIYDKLFNPAKSSLGQSLNVLKDITHFGDIKQYLDLTDQAESANTEATALNNAQIALQYLKNSSQKTVTDVMGKAIFPTIPEGGKIPKDKGEYITLLNKQLVQLGIPTLSLNSTMTELNKTLDLVNTRIAQTTGTLDALTNAEAKLRPNMDDVKSAFDNASDMIDTYKTNIVNLESDITDLTKKISDMNAELVLKKGKIGFEEFQEYAGMAEKYGSQYINEWTNVFDQYGNNMSDVLKTIYEYNDALKETEQETKKVTDANHDLEIAMEQNNIQMLKLQLIGMIRRRGNTRQEQREMKQLEIENTKIKIQEMQNQYDEEVKNNDKTNDEQQTAYDKAKDILQAYIDYQQHQMFLLEDTRQQDVIDLQNSIDQQNNILSKDKTTLQKEYKELNSIERSYYEALVTLSKDPETAEAYKKLLGFDMIDEAKSKYQDYLDFLATNNAGNYTVGTNPIPNQTLVPKTQTGGFVPIQFKELLGQYANGTDYVPETGPYLLHRGESVRPAGEIRNSVIVNINNPQVNSQQDVSKLAETLKNVLRANLVDDKTGKSKHRLA